MAKKWLHSAAKYRYHSPAYPHCAFATITRSAYLSIDFAAAPFHHFY